MTDAVPLLPTLLDHLAWADARARASVRAIAPDAPERARAERLYAHLAAAAHVWLARLEGRAPAHPVWPALPLDAAAALADESVAGLRRIAAGGEAALARTVAYRTSAGTPHASTVADVLAHVALHGSHHRGQIAMLARQAGADPAATDYVVFARERGPGA